jgi:hypothetical protein
VRSIKPRTQEKIHARLWRNVFKKPERTTGVSPPPLRLPPNAMTPEQVKHHHRSKRRGCKGERALSPPSSYVCFVFHIMIKGILQIKMQIIPGIF